MKIKLNPIAIVMLSLFVAPSQATQIKPELSLAKEYQDTQDYKGYWVSEKLDGIRAFWTGSQLLTKNGHKIHAPSDFIKSLPNRKIEGELWAGHGNFHLVQQTVLDEIPSPKAWENIKYMLFDIPGDVRRYGVRLHELDEIAKTINHPNIKVVTQEKVISAIDIHKKLIDIEALGGEGIILRTPDTPYQSGRNNTLIKLKSYDDDEAIVIGYKSGKGKYTGMLGAVLVENAEGIQFLIGSGFSDNERANPPLIGTKINYRYNGKTQNGIPKFARYTKVREDKS